MIINPHSDTRPCAPNYLCAFQRWLQRPLSPVEVSIIAPLERLRSKNAACGRPTRLYIDTTDETAPIARDILILYIRWISAIISPRFNSCIVGRYRSEANEAVRRSYLNNQLSQNAHLLREAKLTPERLASYRTVGWLRRLTPNITTASAKFIDHLRGKWVHTMLILDADRLGHSTEVTYHGYNYRRGRARFQTFRSVLQTAGALLPPIGQSLTIIIGNPGTHPRSIYARHRRQSTAPYSPAFHVLTPDHASHSGPSERRHQSAACTLTAKTNHHPPSLGATASAVSFSPNYQLIIKDTTKVESPTASNAADGPLSRSIEKKSQRKIS